MIGIFLGVTIPVVYIVMGSAIGFRSYAAGIEKDCRRSIKNGRGHSGLCECPSFATVAALFWPVIPLVLVGRRIATKKPVFGFRLRRAERVAKRIAEMEKELGIS